MIKVEHLTKRFRIPHEIRNTVFESIIKILKPIKYEEFNAIDDVSFEVNKGECIGIIGKNGSGKSTLLKLLAGIIRPNSGKITIDGKIVPFLELGLGFSGELTGRDNVYLNGMLLGLSKKELDKRFQEIVEFSELGNFIDTKLKNYSSGMHLRLAFSIAIHAKGDVYLVDEVIAVGDAEFKKKCFDIFQYFKQQGKTIVLVSHAMDTIEEMCEKTILLEKGNLKYFGETKEVIDLYMSDI